MMYSVNNVRMTVRIKTKGEDDCEWCWEDNNNKRDVRMTVCGV